MIRDTKRVLKSAEIVPGRRYHSDATVWTGSRICLKTDPKVGLKLQTGSRTGLTR